MKVTAATLMPLCAPGPAGRAWARAELLMRALSEFRQLLLAMLFAALAIPAPAAAVPQRVHTGVYLLNVNDIDMKTSIYTADFYLWFRWQGAIDPTRSFEMTNVVEKWGMTKDAIYDEPVLLPSGEHYQVFRIQGKFNRKFELWDYPLDRQQIVVRLEETRNETSDLVYVLDERDTGFNPELKLPGWEISGQIREVSVARYDSHFGDVRRSSGTESYARLVYGLAVERSRRAYLIRILLPISVIILSTFLAFLLMPEYVDARIGIVITSLLSIIALHLAEGSDLPNVGYLVLMDKVYNLAYLIILAALVETIFVIRAKDRGQLARARLADRIAAAGLTACYIGGLLVLLWLR